VACIRRGDLPGRPGRAEPGPYNASSKRVTVYVARDCSLCAPALEIVHAAQADLAFELTVVDITGDVELESAYRERLPAVEIDGRVAFTHFVEPESFRAALHG
jgi:glutaredoxin